MKRLIVTLMVVMTSFAGLAFAMAQPDDVSTKKAPALRDGEAAVILAGGCFWCMEPPYEKLDGIREVYSGYTGGTTKGPTYEEVTYGDTGHYEAVQVIYDPSKISLEQIYDIYWRNVDPLDGKGQFCDRGHSYKPAIFVANETERDAAQASMTRAEAAVKRPGPFQVPILDAGDFWLAEGKHQDFYKTNPRRYQYYRSGCGRDNRLKALWGDEAGGAVFATPAVN